MIFDAARKAFDNLFQRETRSVFLKVLGITVLALIALWYGVSHVFTTSVLPWLETGVPELGAWAHWVMGALGVFVVIAFGFALVFLITPVSALMSGLFLDEVAEVVEKRDYPLDRTGQAQPLLESLKGSLRFFGVVIVGNIVALLLLLIPVVNIAAFFLVNGYLLGREFFEFAALRHRPPQEAALFRSKYSTQIFMAGLVLALFLAIPVVNLLTPFFAAAMMVHLHKALSKADPNFSEDLRR